MERLSTELNFLNLSGDPTSSTSSHWSANNHRNLSCKDYQWLDSKWNSCSDDWSKGNTWMSPSTEVTPQHTPQSSWSGGDGGLEQLMPGSLEEGPGARGVNMTECVTVPSSEHVAEIVGRQGCKVKALRAKTNTYIKTPVRGDEPVFVVTGRREDVEVAKREILLAAEHFSQIRASRRGGRTSGGHGGQASQSSGSQRPSDPSRNTEDSLRGSTGSEVHGAGNDSAIIDTSSKAIGNGNVSVRVRVPFKVVGLIVGPRGSTVKRIQQETGTYIVTPSKDRDPVFEIIGSPPNVERARQEIESFVSSKSRSDLSTNGLNESFMTNQSAANLINPWLALDKSSGFGDSERQTLNALALSNIFGENNEQRNLIEALKGFQIGYTGRPYSFDATDLVNRCSWPPNSTGNETAGPQNGCCYSNGFKSSNSFNKLYDNDSHQLDNPMRLGLSSLQTNLADMLSQQSSPFNKETNTQNYLWPTMAQNSVKSNGHVVENCFEQAFPALGQKNPVGNSSRRIMSGSVSDTTTSSSVSPNDLNSQSPTGHPDGADMLSEQHTRASGFTWPIAPTQLDNSVLGNPLPCAFDAMH